MYMILFIALCASQIAYRPFQVLNDQHQEKPPEKSENQPQRTT